MRSSRIAILVRFGLAVLLVTIAVLPSQLHAAGGDPSDTKPSVTLANGYKISVRRRVEVAVDPTRNFHGPSVVRASNGELILTHQDSIHHSWGDVFVHQWRSMDGGFTWQDEGPAADWRDKKMDARHAELGRTSDGRLVMIVQLLKSIQAREEYKGNLGVLNNVWYTSRDNGKTWQYHGQVDPTHEHAVLIGRNLLTHKGLTYFAAWSRHQGNALYVSTDNVRSWRRRSVIFPTTYPDFNGLSKGGPPFYPGVEFLNDGTLLAISYHTPPKNACYIRTSQDQGHTWGPVNKRSELDVWAPRLSKIADGVLMVTGRSIKEHATVAIFSTDDGRTWGDQLILNRPKFPGNYAYTDSIRFDENRFWVFTSTPLRAAKTTMDISKDFGGGYGDVLGVLLQIQKPAKKKK